MSCITMMTDGRTVVAGGDSAAIGDRELRIRATRKVFRSGHYVVGFVGSWRMGQILRYVTDFPQPPDELEDDGLEEFMVTEFIRTIRETFQREGFAKSLRAALSSEATEEGQEVGGLVLVGVRGQIFEIRADHQVVRPVLPYAAIGCGGPVALGALHALEGIVEMSLEQKARIALEAAESYCAGVRAPFYFETL